MDHGDGNSVKMSKTKAVVLCRSFVVESAKETVAPSNGLIFADMRLRPKE